MMKKYSMKGSKGGFTIHDQEQIYQNNRVHIFSDLEFGIDAPTRGSTLNKKHSYIMEEFCFTD